jgi:hypothetical protein
MHPLMIDLTSYDEVLEEVAEILSSSASLSRSSCVILEKINGFSRCHT